MKYVIHHIPRPVDRAIRERSRLAGKKLNETVVELLAMGAGVTSSLPKRRDLTSIAGSWKTDNAFETTLAEQDRVEKTLWR